MGGALPHEEDYWPVDRGVKNRTLGEEGAGTSCWKSGRVGLGPGGKWGGRRGHYIRDSDLKDVVLDQLLPQHDDAELDAELHEAAPRSTLPEEKITEDVVRPSGAQRSRGKK